MDQETKNAVYSSDVGHYPTREFTGVGGFIITLQEDRVSMTGARKLIKSIKDTNSFIDPLILPATTPETLETDLAKFGLTENNWTWPKVPGEKRLDISSGLELSGYGAKDWRKVLACLVSHMKAWHFAAKFNTIVMVLEHDAIFTKTFSEKNLNDLLKAPNSITNIQDGMGIIGLNDPRGATRKASVYLEKVLESTSDGSSKVPAPWIDEKYVPQGIAGNSAYLIGPKTARKLFNTISLHGLWPNDALMCKQLLGPVLHQAYPFYTGLQGISSTTQG